MKNKAFSRIFALLSAFMLLFGSAGFSATANDASETALGDSGIVNVATPTSFTFVMDPFEIAGRGQIYSEAMTFENFSDRDVVINIQSITYEFADNKEFITHSEPFDTNINMPGNDIYLGLKNTDGSINIPVFKPLAHDRDNVIGFVLAASKYDDNGNRVPNKYNTVSLYFHGNINPDPEIPWANGDVNVKLNYLFYPVSNATASGWEDENDELPPDSGEPYAFPSRLKINLLNSASERLLISLGASGQHADSATISSGDDIITLHPGELTEDGGVAITGHRTGQATLSIGFSGGALAEPLNTTVTVDIVEEELFEDGFRVEAEPNIIEGGVITGTGVAVGETRSLYAYANDGYRFVSWVEDGAIISENPMIELPLNRDYRLMANFMEDFEAHSEIHTVAFMVDGSVYATADVPHGNGIGDEWPSEPVNRGGYYPEGWFTQPNGTGELYTEMTPVMYNMTLYATWSGDSAIPEDDNEYDNEYVNTVEYTNKEESESRTGESKLDESTPLLKRTLRNVDEERAITAAEAAGKQARESGQDTAIVNIKDVNEVSRAAFAAMEKAAGMPVLFYADSLTPDGKSVDVRLTADPSKISANQNFHASTLSEEAVKVKNAFNRWYTNPISVVYLGQENSFDTNVKVAAKVDLSGMDTDNLIFYSYDRAQNSCVRLDAQYTVDSKGYLHFRTETSGYIIVTDSALNKRPADESGDSTATNTSFQPKRTLYNVDAEKAIKAAEAAGRKARESGLDTAIVNIKDVNEVSGAAFAAMEKAAGMPVSFYADSMTSDGKSVDVRLTVDPSKISGDRNLYASTLSKEAVKVQNAFQKWYTNRMSVVYLGQEDSFDTNVKVAAKVDLSGMNTDNLVFYSYDKAQNSCVRFDAQYTVDSKNYLHFNTELAGYIIVTDSTLSKRSADSTADASSDGSATEEANETDNPNTGGIVSLIFKNWPESAVQALTIIGFAAAMAMTAIILWAIIPRKNERKR